MGCNKKKGAAGGINLAAGACRRVARPGCVLRGRETISSELRRGADTSRGDIGVGRVLRRMSAPRPGGETGYSSR